MGIQCDISSSVSNNLNIRLMRRSYGKLLLVLLFAFAGARSAAAQSSLVPALHPVYDWLEMQRVNGFAPSYQHEVRPQSRATIVALLQALEKDSLKLSRAHRSLLRDFLNEFDMPRLIANGLLSKKFFRGLPGSIKSNTIARTDPYLYASQTRDSVFSGAFYVNVGLGDLRSTESGQTHSGYLSTKGFKAFVNTSFGVGLHAEGVNYAISQNRELLALDDKLSSPYQYRVEKSDAGSIYEAFVSYRRPYFEAHFGHGSLSMGPSVTDPIIVRPTAPNVSFLRLQLGTPKLNFVSLQGALDSDPYLTTTIYNGDTVPTRKAAQRWFAMQRLTWQPVKQVTFALHELAVYSARGLDIDYVNPVNLQFLSQRDKGDRDNLFIGADLIARPIAGTELFATTLLDDIKRLGQLATLDTSKLILTVGGRQRLLQNVQLAASYTRSDAFTYTHWLPLNAWEQDGKALGQSIGPNAKEVAIRLTSWLPLRTRVLVGTRYLKQGLNPVDIEGHEIANVGGNLLDGEANNYPGLFNGADVYDTRKLELEIETELIRALNISFRLQDSKVTGGLQLRSNRTMDFRLRYGF